MKETLRRWSTYIKEDKTIRNLLAVAAIFLCVGVASFVLKGPSSPYIKSTNPDDHFVHEKPGITNVKSPTVLALCGMPMVMIEPNDDGTATIFGGTERIKERLKQIPNAPIIFTELSKSYQGLSCEGLFGFPDEGVGPSYHEPPSFPQAVPPGHRWSA